MEATRNIEILLDDLIHDQTSIEITIPTALAFIDSQQQKIKKLEEDNATLLREISLKNINLIEVEKENNKLEEEKEELINKVGDYGIKALQRKQAVDRLNFKNTKLKQQIKELEEGYEEIHNSTDLSMMDGDLARDIAERLLNKNN